jgi:adenylyl- and sulfurtransferase ThiI
LLAALDPGQEVKAGFQKQLRLNLESALAKTAAQNARQYRDLMQVAQQQRQQDQKRLLTLILDVHDQHIADTLALRRDLETAVSTADSDLRQDSRRISQLADTMLSAQK